MQYTQIHLLSCAGKLGFVDADIKGVVAELAILKLVAFSES